MDCFLKDTSRSQSSASLNGSRTGAPLGEKSRPLTCSRKSLSFFMENSNFIFSTPSEKMLHIPGRRCGQYRGNKISVFSYTFARAPSSNVISSSRQNAMAKRRQRSRSAPSKLPFIQAYLSIGYIKRCRLRRRRGRPPRLLVFSS